MLLDTRIRLIAAAMRLLEPHARTSLIPNTEGSFPAAREDCRSELGHNDVEHLRGKNTGYFVIVSSTEAYTTFVASRSYNYVFYSDKVKTLCKVIKMEGLKMPSKGTFIGKGHKACG